MDYFVQNVNRAATLLSFETDKIQVAEKLQQDGLSIEESILITIAAQKHLKYIKEEKERNKENPFWQRKKHYLDKPLPNYRKEKGRKDEILESSQENK